MNQPLILVTNDDGITSKGIRTLVDCMKTLGEVVVVAPDSPQSGMGHAITIGNTLRLDRSTVFPELSAYECSGTPVDCVKLAISRILKGRKPDLVVSGINHGSNASISVIYSGTMSAAMEAAIEGIPSIGYSLCDYHHEADFSHAIPFVVKIAKEALEKSMPKGITLNVNIPPASAGNIHGIRVARQSMCKWQDDFDERKDPQGRTYYWMTGEFVNLDKGEDTDEHALSQGYISIVPCMFDLTAYHAMSMINTEWNFEL